MLKAVYVFILYCFSLAVHAQVLEGVVTGADGKAVSFVNIFVPKLKTGTTSNYDGEYVLELPKGSYTILYQCLGYKTKELEVNIRDQNKVLNVQLKNQDYVLPELKVLSSGEDPAYYIMRHAIGMAPYYRNQVSAYTCRVYMKGTGVFEKVPRLIRKQLEKEGLEKGKVFVMETISDIDFKLPDEVKQTVVAMRATGSDNQTSPMHMVTSSLYNARDYDMISPVDRTAMTVYDFKLVGSFVDQGYTINKIKVTPKRKGQDLFEGYIFITDNFWNIHSADMKMKAPMTKIRVKQLYGLVDKNTWLPVSLNFEIGFAGMGLELNYTYVASISNYQITLNPDLDHHIFANAETLLTENQAIEKEMMTMNEAPQDSAKEKRIGELMNKEDLSNKEARQLQRLVEKKIKRQTPPEPLEIKRAVLSSDKSIKNDSAYWAKIRPIPLSGMEVESFEDKDSLVRVSSTPAYQDSVRDDRKKFRLKHLVFGTTYNYSSDSVKTYRNFRTPGLLNFFGMSYNTVDGLRVDYEWNYTYTDTAGVLFALNPYVGYAFARTVVDAAFKLNYRWNGITRSNITLYGGSITTDYNEKYGVPALLNADYTLFLQENPKKFQGKKFVSAAYGSEPVNGLELHLKLSYAQREPLRNHADFTFIDYGKTFTENIPLNTNAEAWQYEKSTALKTQVELKYTPRHRYRIKDQVKIHVPSNYPTFSLGYEGAWGAPEKNAARYHYLDASVYQTIEVGMDNTLDYEVKGGGFLNRDKVYFTDFKHFNANNLYLMFSPRNNLYRQLPLYGAANSTWFAEGHVNYESQRLLLKRISIMGNTLIAENLMFNYLYTPDFKNYTEFGYGIRNIFLFFNFEVNTSFIGNKHYMSGIKLGFNID